GQLIEIGPRLSENEFARCFQVAIEIDSADQGLKSLGSRRYPLPPPACFLTATHHQIASQIKRGRMSSYRFARDEPRAQLGQFSFGFRAEIPKKIFCYDELQNSVAEEFQALIIKMFALQLVSDTGMRQCLCQKEWVTKFVPDSFFERTHVTIM